MSKVSLPEMWGGLECTINRIGDSYLDQLELSGLYKNPELIDVITGLGFSKMRVPILWEKHQPTTDDFIDWSFIQNALNKLKENNILPIAGLMHHGSGPVYTNLLAEEFPGLFANYAGRVATKFPEIEYYTPINEPLTTARFSGLYGFWYPHAKNDVSFINILLNELKATVLAMQEIRIINPNAKLIQTEDLGKTYSTALLSYQANFENNRRWLTWDILSGKFTKNHPLWDHVIRLGIDESKLEFFITNPCPPDIIGVNHYITSERYLDENLEHYPIESLGGNGLHQYADIEAIRVPIGEGHGIEHLLNEVWQRYKIPVAITEVHLNCTREEQLKWFHQIYKSALKLSGEGVTIKAVTAWALFGSFGWNKLLTCSSCDYETGVFDISAGYPRPTALATYIFNITNLSKTNSFLVEQPAWWQLNTRFYRKSTIENEILPYSKQPVIIIGNTGTLGNAFSRGCFGRNIHHLLLGRDEADICNEDKLITIINKYNPWAIINTAGYVKVEEADSNVDACYKINYLGVEKLATLCTQFGVKLMTFSTDLVFDGKKSIPYVETDITNPINTYGKSKRLGERVILKENKDALVIRTAAFFSPFDQHNFVNKLVNDLQNNRKFIAANDIIVSPTYVPHLVNACLDLLIDDVSGIWHLTNKGSVTWYEFAMKIAENGYLDTNLIIPGYKIKTVAKLPELSALSSNKYNLMPTLEQAISEYLSHDRLKPNLFLQKNTADERI